MKELVRVVVTGQISQTSSTLRWSWLRKSFREIKLQLRAGLAKAKRREKRNDGKAAEEEEERLGPPFRGGKTDRALLWRRSKGCGSEIRAALPPPSLLPSHLVLRTLGLSEIAGNFVGGCAAAFEIFIDFPLHPAT